MNIGRLISVVGPVADVQFDVNALPPIHTLLYVQSEPRVPLEVVSQLGEGNVRCIASVSYTHLAVDHRPSCHRMQYLGCFALHARPFTGRHNQ